MTKFLSDDTAPAQVRRNRAIFKWLCAERDNEATNERILLTPEEYQILPRVAFKDFMSHCRDTVVGIIGETPPVWACIGSFSGGASTSRSRTESHPAGKYLGKAHVTLRAKEVFEDLWSEMPPWFGEKGSVSLETVPGNVMFTVPKKDTIDRVACKEPDINMFIQKGIGNYFRDCLRMTGINLNDQAKNRSLARSGSMSGRLATLDLSSASDSVTCQLVAEMLPVCWFTLLDSVRSPVTIIDGHEHVNEMFSSMGNGFTFELESLLFLVLVRAVAHFTRTPGAISVYGDDIVCPTEMVDLTIFVLNWFGFQVNLDKSHWVGDFRESCGGHYVNGVDITPFYIKGPILRLTDLIHAANQLREWASLETGVYPESLIKWCVIDPSISSIWLRLREHVPKCLWGGADFSFKFQLVSDDTPHMRLYSKPRKRDTGLGGYLHWLNATRKRTGPTDGVQTSSVSREDSRMRLRPVSPFNRTVPQLPAYFLEELYADAEYGSP